MIAEDGNCGGVFWLVGVCLFVFLFVIFVCLLFRVCFGLFVCFVGFLIVCFSIFSCRRKKQFWK